MESKREREAGMMENTSYAVNVPLKRGMPNGATVSDWLGTAMTAAGCAKLILSDVREGLVRGDAYAELREAKANAEQCAEEIQAVLDAFPAESV
jgi:hypothetical protein